MSIEKLLARRGSRRALLRTLVGTGGLAGLAVLGACREPAGPAPDRPRSASPVPTAAPTGGSSDDRPAVGIQVWSGGFARVIRDLVQPGFEQAHGVNLTVAEGSSAEQLARLRAERDFPHHIVMGLEDSQISTARTEGLITRLEARELPNLQNVYPEYVCDSGYGVGQSVSWVTTWYNSERIKTAPDSYEAFWNPRYRGRVWVPSLKTTAGLQFLAAASAVGLGKPPTEAQYHPEVGFEMWKRLKPNLYSSFDDFGSVAPLLAQGEIWLAFGPSRLANPFIIKGAPVQRAEAQEGSFLGNQALVLVHHPRLEPLGRDLIDRLLAPAVQTEFSRVGGSGPTNRQTEVPVELASLVPLGEAEAQRLIRLDWGYVHQQRAGWLDRWNQEIAL